MIKFIFIFFLIIQPIVSFATQSTNCDLLLSENLPVLQDLKKMQLAIYSSKDRVLRLTLQDALNKKVDLLAKKLNMSSEHIFTLLEKVVLPLPIIKENNFTDSSATEDLFLKWFDPLLLETLKEDPLQNKVLEQLENLLNSEEDTLFHYNFNKDGPDPFIKIKAILIYKKSFAMKTSHTIPQLVNYISFCMHLAILKHDLVLAKLAVASPFFNIDDESIRTGPVTFTSKDPLTYAIENKAFQIAQLIIEQGTTNSSILTSRNYLHKSQTHEDLKLVQTLIDNGADPKKTVYDEKPIDIALRNMNINKVTSYPDPKVVEFLFSFEDPTDPNFPALVSKLGRVGEKRNHPDLIKLALAHGYERD